MDFCERRRSSQELWAIAAYFNPMGSRRRLMNYRLFRRWLPIPLVTVELSFNGAFELGAGEADVLVQVRDGDILWQKERLLNIGLTALPNSCQLVAWLDCDLIIGGQDWAEMLKRALDKHRLVQPFSRLGCLGPHAPADQAEPGNVERWRPSLAFVIGTGRSARECFGQPFGESPEAKGFMWAARRDLLDKHRFYDAAIVGGGDVLMTSAGFGCWDEAMVRQQMNSRQCRHYRAWAEPFFDAVQASVSYVDCPVFHLWHGVFSDRGYQERHQALRRFDFDPYGDVAGALDRPWRWNSAKPGLHQYLKDFFAARKEDG